jgi:ornithine cyclodeaminase/alanine dehydrogenase-like protein (mu-crystallin family)
VIGGGLKSEIDMDIYKRSDVYVESKEKTFEENPEIYVTAELGELELGLVKTSKDPERVTIFRSRG